MIKLLIENGADVNLINEKNNTALIVALDRGFESAAEILIRNGAAVNSFGQNKETPIMRAAHRGKEEVKSDNVRLPFSN